MTTVTQEELAALGRTHSSEEKTAWWTEIRAKYRVPKDVKLKIGLGSGVLRLSDGTTFVAKPITYIRVSIPIADLQRLFNDDTYGFNISANGLLTPEPPAIEGDSVVFCVEETPDNAPF